MSNIIDDNAFLGVAAVGMTFVILSGGIDLSVGSMIALVSILSAILIERYHIHPIVVFPMMLVLGAAFGAFMGFLIAFFEIAPFLVTLAGLFFLRGLAFSLSAESIPLHHKSLKLFQSFGIPLGSTTLPPTGVLFLVTLLVGIYFAGYTSTGRSIYAIGGNLMSAKLMGIRTQRSQVICYLLSGACAALAGIIYSIYTSSGSATVASGLELEAIAAVVIGGTLLTGGRGSVIGTLVGVFILGLIQTIITFEGTLSSWWTRIVTGLLRFPSPRCLVLYCQFSIRSYISRQKTVRSLFNPQFEKCFS